MGAAERRRPLHGAPTKVGPNGAPTRSSSCHICGVRVTHEAWAYTCHPHRSSSEAIQLVPNAARLPAWKDTVQECKQLGRRELTPPPKRTLLNST